MNALEALLEPIAAVLNRQIRAKTPARELCAELDGKVFAVRVRDTALAAYFVAGADQVFLTTSVDDDPDVVVNGSLLSLARLSGPNGETLIRDGSIDLTGDALLAKQFSKLLAMGRPDLEEELSGFVGDTAAHGIGKFVRSARNWGRSAVETMNNNIGEYLQEESRAVPSRYEIEGFQTNIDSLRDDVARFEARLKKLERRDNELRTD